MAALSMMDPLGMLDMGAAFGLPAILPGVSPSNSSADDFDFFEHDEDAAWDPAASFTTGVGAPASSVGGGSQNAGSPSEEGAEADDGTQKKRGGRRSATTAAKRATHNAVERARRESLNGRFDYLAKQLPMHDVKRASKNAIVEKAIEFVATATHRDRQLTADNASLLAELNELRARLGMPARAATEISALPAPERTRKKAQATVPAPAAAVVTNTTTATAPQDSRSVSPRTVPTTVPQAPRQPSPTVAMPMSMAPTQPVPASAVIQAANANSALKSPTEVSPMTAPMPGFMPAFDWHMAAAAQYGGMPEFFNPFAAFDASSFGAFPPMAPQPMTMAPQFWPQFTRQAQAQAAAMQPFAVAS